MELDNILVHSENIAVHGTLQHFRTERKHRCSWNFTTFSYRRKISLQGTWQHSRTERNIAVQGSLQHSRTERKKSLFKELYNNWRTQCMQKFPVQRTLTTLPHRVQKNWLEKLYKPYRKTGEKQSAKKLGWRNLTTFPHRVWKKMVGETLQTIPHIVQETQARGS